MNPTMIASLRTLLADPDYPNRTALFAAIADPSISNVLACLAPPGSLIQIASALQSGWSCCLEGWERHTDALVEILTDPQCLSPIRMIKTWMYIPNAVGILRDRTDTLIAWAQQRLDPEWYTYLAILLGPSNVLARLLMRSFYSTGIGETLRRWSMVIDPNDPTAWQAMIDPDMRDVLHSRAIPSQAFPAWGWDDAVDADGVLREIVDDLVAGWSLDHPSIRGRIGWLENHVTPDLSIADLARVASIGGSDSLAEAVCARIAHDPRCSILIASAVPWTRLHPRIQARIDETMRRSSDDRWKRTWACAIGQAPVRSNTAISPPILLWRIDRAQWAALNAARRADLVARNALPTHCYGWGVHPDLVARGGSPDGQVFRFWNPDVPVDDLRAWVYADLLWWQRDRQESRMLIDLLMTLPPDRRARFEPIIDWRLNGRSDPTVQPPWEWTDWVVLSVSDRLTRLRERLSVLWGDRATSPAIRFWRARNDGLATVAIRGSEVLGIADPSPILAAILAHVPSLRMHMTDVGPSLPFPNDLDAVRRAQIERLPLDRDAQAYAAWCLRFLNQDMVLGSTLIALHPDVAVALAPVLTTEQRAMVTTSPATKGWDSMTNLRWAAAWATAKEPSMPPIQRRIR